MRYPAIRAAGAREIVRRRLANTHVDTTDIVIWRTTTDGGTDDADLRSLRELGHEIDARAKTTEPSAVNKDALESEFSPRLFDATDALPVEILDDPGFWAWVSLDCMDGFVAWRENLQRETGSVYYDGRSWSECIPLRMYHRGRIVQPEPELASAIARSTDFWRSHIIRVQNSTAPEICKALVESQAEDRMMTDELREFAKRINRLWTNLSLQDYSRDEARSLVADQRRAVRESPGAH